MPGQCKTECFITDNHVNYVRLKLDAFVNINIKSKLLGIFFAHRLKLHLKL